MPDLEQAARWLNTKMGVEPATQACVCPDREPNRRPFALQDAAGLRGHLGQWGPGGLQSLHGVAKCGRGLWRAMWEHCLWLFLGESQVIFISHTYFVSSLSLSSKFPTSLFLVGSEQ